MKKNVELLPKQKRMIAALLSCRTLGAACESVGISRTTLSRWLGIPEFNQALSDAEALTMRDTARNMLAGKDTALETIHDMMTKPTATDNVRRQAAVDWLTFMHRSYELQTIEQRLSELEARVR